MGAWSKAEESLLEESLDSLVLLRKSLLIFLNLLPAEEWAELLLDLLDSLVSDEFAADFRLESDFERRIWGVFSYTLKPITDDGGS